MSKVVQIRGIPDRLHAILRARANKAGMSLSGFLLGELRAIAERPTMEQMVRRLARRQRGPLEQGTAAAIPHRESD